MIKTQTERDTHTKAGDRLIKTQTETHTKRHSQAVVEEEEKQEKEEDEEEAKEEAEEDQQRYSKAVSASQPNRAEPWTTLVPEYAYTITISAVLRAD